MRWLLLILAFWLALPRAGTAGDLTVTVRSPSGAPVADAVVTLAAPHSGPIRFPWAYRMTQKNIQFDPFVLIVPVGADVAFPNLDPVRHHVYSFSPAKSFELKLYGKDETRVVHFDKPGVVQLGCNIHDSMIAFIVVVDTPYAAKTDAQGQAAIRDAPAGAQVVTVWRPYLRAPGGALRQTAQIPRQGEARVVVVADVRAPPMRHPMY
jgi:plastocyanin